MNRGWGSHHRTPFQHSSTLYWKGRSGSMASTTYRGKVKGERRKTKDEDSEIMHGIANTHTRQKKHTVWPSYHHHQFDHGRDRDRDDSNDSVNNGCNANNGCCGVATTLLSSSCLQSNGGSYRLHSFVSDQMILAQLFSSCEKRIHGKISFQQQHTARWVGKGRVRWRLRVLDQE